ncbi:MAG: DUF4432 family protein [Synergistaceae bacterium]|jgi:hypothetical protein|nr:DUF4432 family protein [Synergistaceae bacterium]
MNGKINLRRSFFSECEKELGTWGGLRASTFIYSTGVYGIRVGNERGEIVVLPWNGQMIWDVVFDGVNLKMKSQFSEPVDSTLLVDTYGAFLTHCGARRMGTPAPEDDHPLHGELPCAPYREAFLTFGEESGKWFLGVGGVYSYKQGFGDYYDASPEVRLFEDSTVLDIRMSIKNLSNYPMDLMYMCHANFLAGEDTRIVQSSGWSVDDMILRTSIPSHVKPTEEFMNFLEKLKSNPELTARMRPGDEYDPEIVFFLRNVAADPDGYAHFMQVFPDGRAHYVTYRPRELDHHVRWILKDKNQHVFGILPATCEPEGYTAEKKKGTVRSLAPGDSADFRVRAGLVDAGRAAQIERIVNGCL